MQRFNGPLTIESDDSMPVVLQSRGNDGSETHAITVYEGSIYDLASKYILHKT
jgi:hypothetical protein